MNYSVTPLGIIIIPSQHKKTKQKQQHLPNHNEPRLNVTTYRPATTSPPSPQQATTTPSPPTASSATS
jgi:hypothetical protein